MVRILQSCTEAAVHGDDAGGHVGLPTDLLLLLLLLLLVVIGALLAVAVVVVGAGTALRRSARRKAPTTGSGDPAGGPGRGSAD